jgi:hypothetical protein
MRKLLGAFILILVAHFVQAQETTADIVGTVLSGKSALVGATVTALNQSTGTRATTTTRQTGRFNLPNLRVGGPYQLSVSYAGYETAQKDSIFLLLGQEFKADFDLTASATNLENVVVTSPRLNAVINSSRTGSQEIINRTQIERLPTINRSLHDFKKQ